MCQAFVSCVSHGRKKRSERAGTLFQGPNARAGMNRFLCHFGHTEAKRSHITSNCVKNVTLSRRVTELSHAALGQFSCRISELSSAPIPVLRKAPAFVTLGNVDEVQAVFSLSLIWNFALQTRLASLSNFGKSESSQIVRVTCFSCFAFALGTNATRQALRQERFSIRSFSFILFSNTPDPEARGLVPNSRGLVLIARGLVPLARELVPLSREPYLTAYPRYCRNAAYNPNWLMRYCAFQRSSNVARLVVCKP
jgi:hypothetical protein